VSLILDALRKADSERARESVPGLYTQPVPPLSLEAVAHPGARPKPWMWIGIVVGVALLVSLAWFVAGREAPRPLAERAPAPNALVPEPAREVAAPAPWPSQDRKTAQKQPGRAEDAPASQPPTLTPLYSREQLPDNVRAALPPLAVGGSIYSSTPANRSLILDGRLYRESDQLSTDLQLEAIGMKTAVLRFRDYRFEIRY
jgi:general secretion pathway protein B